VWKDTSCSYKQLQKATHSMNTPTRNGASLKITASLQMEVRVTNCIT
jgi:hypothetical protein